MTWFLIIIAVIALLIYLINRDKKEILTNRTSKRGPLNERYSIIVNELLKEPGTNIVSESTEKIRILAVKDDSSIEIEIHEMYSEFIIRLNIKKDSLQVMSKAWKFSLNIDQRQVLSKI